MYRASPVTSIYASSSLVMTFIPERRAREPSPRLVAGLQCSRTGNRGVLNSGDGFVNHLPNGWRLRQRIGESSTWRVPKGKRRFHHRVWPKSQKRAAKTPQTTHTCTQTRKSGEHNRVPLCSTTAARPENESPVRNHDENHNRRSRHSNPHL